MNQLTLFFKANKAPSYCLKTLKTLIKSNSPVPQALSLMLTLVSGCCAVLLFWMLDLEEANQERCI